MQIDYLKGLPDWDLEVNDLSGERPVHFVIATLTVHQLIDKLANDSIDRNEMHALENFVCMMQGRIDDLGDAMKPIQDKQEAT